MTPPLPRPPEPAADVSPSPASRDDRGPILRVIPGRCSYAELLQHAQRAERQGRRGEARAFYEEALARLREAPRAADAAAILRWIARTHQVDGDAETALDCLDAALAVAEVHADLAGIGHARNLQAIVAWQQGRLDEAERLYHAARDAGVRAGDARLAAMTAQNLGVIANIRGDLELARQRYEESLAAYRVLGLPHDVSVALNNLGMLYTHQERWDAAMAAYDEALRIAEAVGGVTTRITIEVNVAECWVAQGEYERARVTCERVMDLARRAEDSHADGELHKVCGVIARETGELARAEQYLVRCAEIAERRGDLLLMAEAAKEQAEVHLRQGRNRDTLHCLNRAHRIFSQLRARRALADVDLRVANLEGDFLEVVRRWSESIESKDHYTQGHCERVADLACALAARVGLDVQSLFWFRIAAMLHDVGKLVIPSEILNKPAQLTGDEWALVKQHPVAGAQMLADIDFPWDVRPIVESHHERWDGAGYPHGLAGAAIPLTARVLCIADVYDALTSERSYKRPLSHAEALDVMRLDVGRQFDPELFALFEGVAAELGRTPALGPTPGPAPASRPSPLRSMETVPATDGRPVQTDELTGLPLRRAFIEHARDALGRRQAGDSLALLVIDVDHFKLVNDTYGHLEGDEVLRAVAGVLRRQVRASTFLGRYAGDEFVVLLPSTTRGEAIEAADRLRTAVQALPLAAAGRGGAISLTLSIGVACAPEHGESVEQLFAAADAALYDAKRKGRNAVASVGGPQERHRPPGLHLDKFTGRHVERARLVQLFGDSVRGEPRAVAVVGEAGIGKTALVRELGPEVRMRAGSLVLGRCVDADVRMPYGPWAAVLNAVRVLRVVAERPWRELPRLVPTFGGMPGDGEGSRFALFEEVSEYLRLAASARPLVIVLDDMQWADSPSWDLLEHVMARLERDRILICLTIREEDALGDVEARRSRLSRDERFHELRLARLTREELRQWVEQALQQDVSPEFLAFLYRQTEGNAFFTVQVLRAMLEEESLWWTGTRWEWRAVSDLRLPVAVKDLISRRIGRLSPAAQRTLAAASVIGRALDVDLAVEAGVASEDELLDAVDEGLAASVLEVTGLRGDDRIVFTHGLLAEAIRRLLNPQRLKRIHERVGYAMERRGSTAVAEIAGHFDAAGVGERAYAYALRAADRATAVYAHGEATAFLQMAQRHASSGADLAAVRFRLTQVAEAAGRYQDAEELAQLALDWFGRQPEPLPAAQCRRALVRLRALQGATPHATCDACAELLADAECYALPSERIALLGMVSQARSRLGDAATAEHLARECVRLAEQLGERRSLAEALTRLGTALLVTRASESLALYGRALELFGDVDDACGQVRCLINLGVANSRLGSSQAAEDAYARALARGREAHSPDLAGIAALNLGVIALKRGRHEYARARIREAHELFSRVKNEAHRLAALYNLAHLAHEEGKLDDARPLYCGAAGEARALGMAEVEVGAIAGAGLVALRVGDLESARRDAAAATGGAAALGSDWFQGRELFEALLIALAVAEGRGDEAYARFTRALGVAHQRDAYGAAWLVAECASTLADARPDLRPVLQETVSGYVRQVDSLGFVPLAARYAAMLAAPTEVDRPSANAAASVASAAVDRLAAESAPSDAPALGVPRITTAQGAVREKSA